MKQGWEIKKVGECFDSIKNGATIKQERGATGIPITRIETLSGGVFNRDRLGYANIHSAEKYASYILDDGDMLLSHINSKTYIGRTVVYNKMDNEEIIHGMNLLRLKTIRTILSPYYAFYCFKSESFRNQIASYRKDAVNQSSIPVSDLKKITIPVPPLPEQEKIVSELDCLSGIIEKKRQQLKELDALAQSIFYEMFGNPVENERGWEVKSIKEIGKVITGNTPSRSVSEYYNSKDIEWIKTDNIESGKIYPTIAKEYLSKDGMMKGRVVECGAILVTCIAGSIASIGGCCIADRKVAFNQQINAVVPIGDINSLFLYYCLILSKRLIQDSASNGMKHLISKSNFEQIPLPLPPLPLQQSFAQKIEAIEQQKALIKQSVAEVETLFNARMQEYFE